MTRPKALLFDGACHCLRCGHRWHAAAHYRDATGAYVGEHYTPPKRCASCRSPRWHFPVLENRRGQSQRLQGNDLWSGPVKNSRKNFSQAARAARLAKAFPGKVRRS